MQKWAVFHPISKHSLNINFLFYELLTSWEYNIFNNDTPYVKHEMQCLITRWNTVSNAWYYFSNRMILEGEIKDAKMSSFSSDFQTLIKHSFP